MNDEMEYNKEKREDGTIVWSLLSNDRQTILRCLFRDGYDDIFYQQYSQALYKCAQFPQKQKKNLMNYYKEQLTRNGMVFPAPFILKGVTYQTPHTHYVWGDLASEKKLKSSLIKWRSAKQRMQLASKDISLEEKRCVNGLVDRALKDVLDVRKNPSDLHGSNIEITGLTNKKVQRKSIKMYLYRLANLNYRSVRIETTRIAAAHEFYEDPNHPGWFVGNVSCTQTFTAALKAAEQPVYLKDKVERTFKIYIRRVEYREKNHKRYQWQVKIHHITARDLAQ